MAERIAAISDVHGNLTALEAVLADIGARGITRIVNLGDLAGKGPRGSAVVDRCREACEVTVRGNWDDALRGLGPDNPDARPAYRWWNAELRPDQLDWLATLPLSHDLILSGRRIRLFHASAVSPHVRVHRDHTDEEFDGMFASTPMTGDLPAPDVVGYGDVHVAYVETRDGRTLFNTGSVGNPLDDPTSVYAVLEGDPGSADRSAPLRIEHVRVPYDVDAEVAVAHAAGMPEAAAWETELRTSVYRGIQSKS